MSGLCVVFANVKPRKLAGIMSDGMTMSASNVNHTELMRPPDGSKVGERIYLEGNPILSNKKLEVLNPEDIKDISRNTDSEYL